MDSCNLIRFQAGEKRATVFEIEKKTCMASLAVHNVKVTIRSEEGKHFCQIINVNL